MMKICSLTSGSKGNSLFIESSHARILIDAGLSALQIKNRLKSIDVAPESLDAIIITHAHRDHISAVDVLSHQLDIPVFGHPDTLRTLTYFFKRIQKIIPCTGKFSIKDLDLHPFPVSHDSIPTVGYLIRLGTKTLSVSTDLGIVTPEAEENISQAQFIVIESNHDSEMLLNGPYSWELKQRIASRLGHLSNHDTGFFLKSIMNGKIQKILLAHLSEENNLPALAKNTVLDFIGYQHNELLDVLEQKKVSAVFTF